MRARNIKPMFFLDDELAAKPPLARILFEGLWCAADREGRLEDRPRRLKAEILPYDDCDINELLDLLQPSHILRYTVSEKGYIWVINFLKHQHPHHQEKPSEIPPHPDDFAPNPDNNEINPDNNECNPSDSLIPDSLIPESPPTPPAGGTVAGEKTGAAGKVGFRRDFEEWWERYPNKQGRPKAIEHYLRRRAKGQSRELLLAGRDRYKAAKARQGSTTFANGSTFLNPKPCGDSANIDDYIGDGYQVSHSCGSCRRGDPAIPKYCVTAGREVSPDDRPCKDHEGAL